MQNKIIKCDMDVNGILFPSVNGPVQVVVKFTISELENVLTASIAYGGSIKAHVTFDSNHNVVNIYFTELGINDTRILEMSINNIIKVL